jgi:hypothetical protein
MIEAEEMEAVELNEKVKERIAQRTGRRVRALEVKAVPNRVVISGWVSSYYLKQLALEAVLDVIRAVGVSGLEFNIQVGTADRNWD